MRIGKYFTCGMILISLVSCDFSGAFSYDSLEDYIKTINGDCIQHSCGHSSLGLDNPRYLLPSVSFLADYPYLEGGYYDKNYGDFRQLEQVIINLTYGHNYFYAKSFANTHLDLSSKNTFYYNGYYFFENLAYAKRYNKIDETGENKAFPSKFTMYGYNDSKRTLIFLGFGDFRQYKNEGEKERILDDWGYFLNTYYSEYYDFND